jgi:pyridoxamine 5'-phosphate oxidase
MTIKSYQDSLSSDDLLTNPFDQFNIWFNEASSHTPMANAMTLTTIQHDQTPSSRTVLLKGFDDNGFTFFTNYNSNKANDIEHNNNVCILFPWLFLERQVIIKGSTRKVSPEKSDDYFKSRPTESQIGAWASPQSQAISSRKHLDDLVTNMENKLSSKPFIERPEFWGGYIISPLSFEFWQGRQGRLHDRFIYTKSDVHNQEWDIQRLAP